MPSEVKNSYSDVLHGRRSLRAEPATVLGRSIMESAPDKSMASRGGAGQPAPLPCDVHAASWTTSSRVEATPAIKYTSASLMTVVFRTQRGISGSTQ